MIYKRLCRYAKVQTQQKTVKVSHRRSLGPSNRHSCWYIILKDGWLDRNQQPPVNYELIGLKKSIASKNEYYYLISLYKDLMIPARLSQMSSANTNTD